MAIVYKQYMPTPTASQTITSNGTYNVVDKASAVVNVPTPEPDLVDLTITENGIYTHSGHDGYDEVTVNVPIGTTVDVVETITATAMANVIKGNILYINNSDLEYTNNITNPLAFSSYLRKILFNNAGTRCYISTANSPYLFVFDTTTSPWTAISSSSTVEFTRIVNDICLSPDNTKCVITFQTSPYIKVYDITTIPWTDITNIDTEPWGHSSHIVFSPTGTYCAISASNANIPFDVYDTTTTPWTRQNLTKTSNYPAAPAFSPDGNIFVVAYPSSYTTSLDIYDTTTTPWTKLSSPSYCNSNYVNSVFFNNSGTRCIVNHNSRGGVISYDTTTYPWSVVDGLEDLGNGVHTFKHPNTDICFVMIPNNATFRVYDMSTSPWTQLSGPATPPSYQGVSLAVNSQETIMLVGMISSPYYTMYDIESDYPHAYKANGILQTNINTKYGIAKSTVSANSNVDVDIILDN